MNLPAILSACFNVNMKELDELREPRLRWYGHVMRSNAHFVAHVALRGYSRVAVSKNVF